MDIQQLLLQSVSNYCFPAVVALYLLFKLDARLEALEQAMHQLTNAFTKQQFK